MANRRIPRPLNPVLTPFSLGLEERDEEALLRAISFQSSSSHYGIGISRISDSSGITKVTYQRQPVEPRAVALLL
jgi:hypothetical protein